MTASEGLPRALRIDRRGSSITVHALLPERLTHYGFGTFLEQVEPGEISISQSALDGVLACPYRSGLQGMEIFNGNIIAWGSPRPTLTISLANVSLHQGAAKWFQECAVIEQALDTEAAS